MASSMSSIFLAKVSSCSPDEDHTNTSKRVPTKATTCDPHCMSLFGGYRLCLGSPERFGTLHEPPYTNETCQKPSSSSQRPI